ncbi:hypothetical protein F383_37151 [Gossypium arboreum]|uniref:Uncharacterized protein n=1 Tax=Gossypium arboreum TaxID=29729 RepID=A0A0B0M713_GOSAR|nr:hypothetical protein F383_37151 [Gossypium arboreum]
MEKIDLRGKSTRPGLSHTDVRVPLAGLKHDLHVYTTRPCLLNSLNHGLE